MSPRLAHYRVDEVIGAGSYATVHRAVDDRLDDIVAIKILAENHSLNPEIRERFIAEGRSLRRVGGEHVVSVYDIGESERLQPYLVLEFADRGTVRQRVEELRGQGWRATDEDLLAFARPLAAAVGAVHRAQLVHRDLSPGNLLLTSRSIEPADDEHSATGHALIGVDERLLIADLGMCKDLAVNSGLTVSGGTEGFRPPEQDGPGVVDTRADIWAMSALMAWLVQGCAVSPALTRVLKRGMSARPRRRQPDTSTWLKEIQEALAPPEPTSASPVTEAAVEGGRDAQSLGTTAITREQRPHRSVSRWRRVLAMSTVILALLAGSFVGGLIFGEIALPPAQTATTSISISGPDEIQVGVPAVFTAAVDGVDSWVWTLPSNRFVSDHREVSVTATSPGTAEVVLRSRTADGKDLEARHTIRVIE